MDISYASVVFLLSVMCNLVYCNSIAPSNDKTPCRKGQYYNQHLERCRACRRCPKNQVVINPCEMFKDIHCGPLTDLWKGFNLKPIGATQKKSNPVTTVAKVDDAPSDSGTVTVGMFQISEEWYTISMVLLGILCVVSIALTVYIILVCFVCKKKKRSVEKVIDCEPGSEYAQPLAIETYINGTNSCGHYTRVLHDTPFGNVLSSPSGNLILNYTYIEPKDSLLKNFR